MLNHKLSVVLCVYEFPHSFSCFVFFYAFIYIATLKEQTVDEQFFFFISSSHFIPYFILDIIPNFISFLIE